MLHYHRVQKRSRTRPPKVRSAKFYQKRDDKSRALAESGRRSVARSLLATFRHLRSSLPVREIAIHINDGDYAGAAKAASTDRFADGLKTPVGKLVSLYWLSGERAASKISRQVLHVRSRVGKVGPEDEERDQRGRWSRGGSSSIPAANQGGDCYEVAARAVLGQGRLGAALTRAGAKIESDVTFVQAEVVGQGPISGVHYGHAWAEYGGKVYDFSSGKSLVMPKREYYALGRVEQTKGKYAAYTAAQMKEKLVTTGVYGPWELSVKKYSPDEERVPAGSPDGGEWTSGGGAGGTYVDAAGTLHTDDVEAAVRALAVDQAVELNQPREATILLDRLAAVAREMEAQGQRAPNFNLCKISIAGTNLFCADTMGIPRVQMPQLKGVPELGSAAADLTPDSRGEVDVTDKFAAYLADKGYTITDTDERADFLRATQNELNGVKVAGIMGAIRNGTLDEARLFVSKDNYIVDGHHRWAATVGIDLADNKPGDLRMPVARVNAGIIPLLKEANDFAAKWGIPQVAVSQFPVKKYSEDEARDYHGRWTLGAVEQSVRDWVDSHGFRRVVEQYVTGTFPSGYVLPMGIALVGSFFEHWLSIPYGSITFPATVAAYQLGMDKDLNAMAEQAGVGPKAMAGRLVSVIDATLSRSVAKSIDPEVERRMKFLRRLLLDSFAKYAPDEQRDEHGRWVGPGAAEMGALSRSADETGFDREGNRIVAWHGTRQSVIDSVLEHGITRPGGFFTHGSVYVTNTYKSAVEWARQLNYGKVCVFELAIPRDQWAKFDGAPVHAPMDIPPQWIKAVYKPSSAGTVRRLVAKVSGYVTAYAAIVVDGVEKVGPADEARDERGRWTGETDNGRIVVYHGTSEAALKSIAEKGLVPRGGPGADEWARQTHFNSHDPDMTAIARRTNLEHPDRATSVYLAQTAKEATAFANYAGKVTHSDGVVLKVELPPEVLGAMIPDELSYDYRFPMPIPASWIKGRVRSDQGEVTILPLSKAEAVPGSRTVYLIFFCRPDKVTKAPSAKYSFDLLTEEVQAALRDYQAGFIGGLAEDAQSVVYDAILDGVAAGLSPDEIALELSQVIGLTERQAAAVDNYEKMLTDAADFSPSQIADMVAKYADASLISRAEQIALTESTRMVEMGLSDAYDQAVSRGVFPSGAVTRRWQLDLDEKTCEVCISIVDQTPEVGTDEEFQSIDGPVDFPPVHPNCRCSVDYVTDLDQLDATD